jgi:hypothetical protein
MYPTIPTVKAATSRPIVSSDLLEGVTYVPIGGLVDVDGTLYQIREEEDGRLSIDAVELAVQVGRDSFVCVNCRSMDTVKSESWGSFGGTTEGYAKCSECGATVAWLDDSAVR